MSYENRSQIDELPAHVQRMVAERDELADRHQKLDAFLLGSVFATLPAEDQRLMHEQTRHMAGYLAVLNARIDRSVA